jgi:hypothetical protein
LIVISFAATKAIGLAPTTVASAIVKLCAASARIGIPFACTTSEFAIMSDIPPDVMIVPSSVLIVVPLGIKTSGSALASVRIGARPLEGVNDAHASPSLPHPSAHDVVVVDDPSALHVVSSPDPHVAAPGAQPQTSAGQPGGVIVQMFLVPSDGGYAPFTSQNG